MTSLELRVLAGCVCVLAALLAPLWAPVTHAAVRALRDRRRISQPVPEPERLRRQRRGQRDHGQADAPASVGLAAVELEVAAFMAQVSAWDANGGEE